MSDTGDHERQARNAARDEALVWFMRLNGGDATEADHDRFGLWLRADTDHLQAYAHLETVWSDLDYVPDPRKEMTAAARRSRVSRRAVLAGFTGMAAAATLVVASGVTLDDVEGLIHGDFRTGTGERRTVTTPDGSTVEMDAGTAISVHFKDGVRQLRLLSGRAVFTVVADGTRPFEVVCGGGSTRMQGGVFAVHKRPNDTAVAVVKEAASVHMCDTGNDGPRVRIAAGERVTYGPGGIGQVVSAADGAETAWQRNRMVFRERPLGDVVADLNRYRHGRIVIWDETLNALRVDGAFNTDTPDAALQAIVSTLPVRETRLTPYLVLLSKA